MNYDPIKNDKEFEHFCKWIARDNFGPNVFLYSKYNQNGIDIYWTYKGKYHVIQCKQRSVPNPSELISSLENDFNQAKKYFQGNLKQFIFATTVSLEIIETKVKRKNGPEESVLDACIRLSALYDVDVVPWHWDYLQEKVSESPFLLKHLLNLEDGADLINEDFIESHSLMFKGINEKQCKLDYYGGQEDIQWYGITQNIDAPREIYDSVIERISSSFKKDEHIASVIRGDGGSGKSVFLRRLAVDLREKYSIYWLRNNIEPFLHNEFIYDVQKHPESKYIIILEDWYRNIERAGNNVMANQLLNEIKRVPNARLIIGDRKGKKKMYDDFVGSSHIYDLHNSENINLLQYIFKEMPEWNGLVSNDELNEITNATLFIALFVFCYGEHNDKDSLVDRYKRIFKSDYSKLLEKNDPFEKGIANTLYLYANLYSNYGISISPQTLMDWSCYYSSGPIPSVYLSNNNRLLETRVFKKYLHIEKWSNKNVGTIQYLRFHHDTMAEQGWANKHELIEIEFNEGIIDDLIKVTKKNKRPFDLGKIYYHLSKQPGEKGEGAAREYLKTENPHINHWAFCSSLNLLKGEEIAKQAARDFLRKENHPVHYWAFCNSIYLLKGEEIAEQAARDFLKTENSYLYSMTFCASIHLLKEDEEAKSVARDFLKTEKPYMNQGVFCSCLDLLKGEEASKQAAMDFLQTKNPHIKKESFCYCLDLLKGKEAAEQAARNFLQTENPHINFSAFCSSLNQLKGEEVAEQAARNFLQTENPHLNFSAFCSSLNQLKGEDVAEQAARDFLQTENPHIKKEVFCSCLDLLKGEDVAKQAARDFLITENPHINFSAFCSSLRHLKGEEVAKQAARNFLKTENPHLNFSAFCSCLITLDIEVEDIALKIIENRANENWSFVFHSLGILNKTNKHNTLVSKVVSEIIATKEKDWFQYRELLKIPLFNIPVWVNETEYLIRNWHYQIGRRRNLLFSILNHSYKDFPEKLYKMSIGIIRNWESDLAAKTKHKAYFTRCLANIEVSGDEILKAEVITICKEICDFHKKKPLMLTPNLEEWLKIIATTNEFPKWTIEEQ